MDFKNYLEADEPFEKKVAKLFGADAQRMTTAELRIIFAQLKESLGKYFNKFELVRALPSKPDHGDIDILVLGNENINVKDILNKTLGNNILSLSKNGNIISILYKSPKPVHVDFILSTNEELHSARRDYYAYNDLSAIIGIIAKKLNFKYGTNGFFKRFQDKKSIWHDVFITNNLMDGLRLLGFTNPEHLFQNIQNHDDILKFVQNNPFLDSSWFELKEIRHSDRQAAQRPGIKYLMDNIRQMSLTAKIHDEDHFLKQLMPEIYDKVNEEKELINKKTYNQSSKYNGNWLINTFNIKPGPVVGKLLKAISDNFGDNLDETPETEMINFVKQLI